GIERGDRDGKLEIPHEDLLERRSACGGRSYRGEISGAYAGAFEGGDCIIKIQARITGQVHRKFSLVRLNRGRARGSDRDRVRFELCAGARGKQECQDKGAHQNPSSPNFTVRTQSGVSAVVVL